MLRPFAVPFVVVCCSLAFLQTAAAQEWTRFRGPNGSGVSPATTIPTEWTADTINWRVDLPGTGHGCPVIWGDRIFVQCDENKGQQRLLRCLSVKDGSTLWTRKFPGQTHKKHAKNSFASSTPAVDSERVYVAWGVPGQLTMSATTHDGQPVWNADLGGFKGGHGFAASPIVHEGLVILNNDQDGESSLVAVDAKTGAIRWQTPRKSERLTFSTPCIYQSAERGPELIFTNWRHGITAINPKTGKVNWERSVFDQSQKERAIGSPVVAGDLVIGSCGFVTTQKHVVAVRPSAKTLGEATPNVELVYEIERNVPHIPTVLVHDDLLFLWADKGIVSCHAVADGKLIWQKRVGGNFLGSPVWVDGRLFAVNDAGEVVVLAASREFAELARNPLDDPCHSTPAIANGRMYVRTFSQLVSIGGK